MTDLLYSQSQLKEIGDTKYCFAPLANLTILYPTYSRWASHMLRGLMLRLKFFLWIFNVFKIFVKIFVHNEIYVLHRFIHRNWQTI